MTNELAAAEATYIWSAFKIFIDLSILMFCGGTIWCLLPKKTDDPLVRLVKTTGLMGGLFISLLVFLIILK